MASKALAPYGGQLVHAETWTNLTDGAKRIKAIKAGQEKNVEALTSLLEAYTTIFSGSMSAHTKSSYKRGITLLCNEGFNLIRLRPDEAALYIRRLELDYAKASVSSYRSAVRVLYDALIWADAYRDDDKDRPLANPFAGVRIRSDTTAPEDKFGTYTDKDIKLLLPHLNEDTHVLLFLGAHGGLRISEMLKLQWRDMDLRNGVLKVLEGKGKKRRSVPMTNTLRQVLEQARQRATTPLPYSDRFAASYAFETVCHQAGVIFQGKALHGLRHYAGTKAYQATHDILRVGKLLGHSKVETTARYAKILMSGFDESYLTEFRSMLMPQ
jgi:integrase/recombinase XerC